MPNGESLEAITQMRGNIDVMWAIAHNGWADRKCVGGQFAGASVREGEACRVRGRPRWGRGDFEEGAEHAKNLSGR